MPKHKQPSQDASLYLSDVINPDGDKLGNWELLIGTAMAFPEVIKNRHGINVKINGF